MNYAVEMCSDALVYIPIFINISLNVQKLIGGMRIQTDTQTCRHTDTHTDRNVIS
jgi:hypothetical protein